MIIVHHPIRSGVKCPPWVLDSAPVLHVMVSRIALEMHTVLNRSTAMSRPDVLVPRKVYASTVLSTTPEKLWALFQVHWSSTVRAFQVFFTG